MSNRANVTSVDALKDFRANLLVYLGKARPVLEEVNADVSRTRVWLEDEQRRHWENQVKRRTRELQQAQEALFSARVSNLKDATSMHQLAVQKAKRALEESEAKLKMVKQRNRQFADQVEPLVKQLEQLHTFLSNDLPKAAAYLSQAVDSLEAYAQVAKPEAPVVTTSSEDPSKSSPPTP
jgi:chromosome segregation ATPase